MPDTPELTVLDTPIVTQENSVPPISTTRDLVEEYGGVFDTIDLKPEPISWYIEKPGKDGDGKPMKERFLAIKSSLPSELEIQRNSPGNLYTLSTTYPDFNIGELTISGSDDPNISHIARGVSELRRKMGERGILADTFSLAGGEIVKIEYVPYDPFGATVGPTGAYIKTSLYSRHK